MKDPRLRLRASSVEGSYLKAVGGFLRLIGMRMRDSIEWMILGGRFQGLIPEIENYQDSLS